MTLYEFLEPITPYITIRLFIANENERSSYEETYKGVKDDIPIMYLEKTPKFVTVSFDEHILNVDLD